MTVPGWWRRRYGCRAVGRMLQRHLDGELDERRAALVGAHLDACRACRLEAATYDQIRRTLAGRGARPVPPEAVDRLRAFAGGLMAR